jgi:hypothetical protein
MSNSDIEELLSPYEGPNDAHKAFRQEFKYLNALYYLIVSAKDVLREHLKRAMADAEAAAATQGRDGKYALGIVTHPISTSQFQAIYVPKPDAETMVHDFDGFIDVLNRHCIIGVHRAIVDFAIDLLIELNRRALISIPFSEEENLHQRRLRPADLARHFEEIGEPIHADMNGLQRLHLLGETRNLLEHNNGRVTPKYRRLAGAPSLSEGDPVHITSKEVGEAFVLIETTAASLNRRVLKRFNL